MQGYGPVVGQSSRMSLRKGLRADSEDELLQMQAEFQASGKAPAAKVAGRKSRSPPGIPPRAATTVNSLSQDLNSEGLPDVVPESETSDGWQIVGDVCERQPQSNPAPQLPPAILPTSFPKATHRRVSKFALSRQAKDIGTKPRDNSSAAASPSLSGQTQHEHTFMRGVPKTGNTAQGITQGTGSARSQGPASATDSVSHSNTRDDASQMTREIAAENQKVIASMQPEQVERAKQEIRERLDPSIVAFMEKRAAQRSAQHRASMQGSANSQHDSSAKSQQPPGKSGATDRAADASETRPPAEPRGLLQDSLQGPTEVSQPKGDSIVARMCFNIDGELVAVRDAMADAVPATERDILRQEEGALGNSYTVQDICQLARSALPAQRAIACRHLAGILARAQQGLSGDPATPVADTPEAAEVTWHAMWRHMTRDCEAALVLRLALDDANSGVVAAAAAGLHALLDSTGGASQDYFPDPELPAVPVRRLERPHPSAAWMSLYPASEQEDPSFPQNTVEADARDDSAADPRQLAKHDTLAALLRMQVLDRIKYLLTSAAAPAALQQLLALLGDLARGGADVAHAICDTPGLVAGLMAVLDLRSAAAAPQTARTEHAARPAALHVLCLLCCGGAPIARQLLAEGLESRVLHFVVQPALQMGGDSPAEQAALQLQVTALRIWKVLAAMGLSSLSLETAYPAVCRHLEPRLDGQSAAGPLAQSHAALEASVTAEALGLCWTIIQQDAALGRGRLVSERFRAAVAAAAATWLQAPALEALDQALLISLEPEQHSLARRTSALFYSLGAAVSLVALDKDACGEKLSALASAASSTASMNMPGLFGRMLSAIAEQQLDGRDTGEISAHAYLAVSAALRACLRALQRTHPEQATTLARHSLIFLAEGITFGDGSMQSELHPWLVMHLEQRQSWAAALVTTIEVLQMLSQDIPEAGAALQLAAYDYHGRAFHNALMRMLIVLPPGSEDLALRALSCLLSHDYTQWLCKRFEGPLGRFLSGKSTLAEAALRHTAWWQEDCEKADPAQLPSAEELRETLLHAYARHWLGLVPEGALSAAATVLPPLSSSLFRQPTGSRLPLPADWLYHVGWESNAPEEEPQPPLPSIPEEGAGSAAKLSKAAACLLTELPLEVAGTNRAHSQSLGTRLCWLLDLLFGTVPESPTPVSSSRPWTDPLTRQTAAALLHMYLMDFTGCRPEVSNKSLTSVTEACAARWAMEFASSSYGDALLASAVAVLLLPQMPPGVQVTVLDVLDQENALHLLPSVQKALSLEHGEDEKDLFTDTKPPAEVLRMYRRLLDEGSLNKAAKLGSLPHSIATKWA